MYDLRDNLKEGLFFILKNNGNVAFVEINDLLKAFDADPIEPFVVFFDYERINGKDTAIAKIATSTFPHTLIRSLRGGTVDVVEQVVDFFECQNKIKSLTLKPIV